MNVASIAMRLIRFWESGAAHFTMDAWRANLGHMGKYIERTLRLSAPSVALAHLCSLPHNSLEHPNNITMDGNNNYRKRQKLDSIWTDLGNELAKGRQNLESLCNEGWPFLVFL